MPTIPNNLSTSLNSSDNNYPQLYLNGASQANNTDDSHGALDTPNRDGSGVQNVPPTPTSAYTNSHVNDDLTIFNNPDTQQLIESTNASDEHNALCVVALYGEKICYVKEWGWMHYDGTHWTTERAEFIVDQCIIDTFRQRVQHIFSIQSQNPNDSRYSDVFRRCIPNTKNINNIRPRLRGKVERLTREFDTDKDSVNCANGVLHLPSRTLTPHSPNQLYTYCISTSYQPNTNYSEWEKWLNETVEGGIDTVKWLQMMTGYMLSGHTNEERLLYIYGPTRSGKGTFTETIMELIGKPLATEIEFSTLTRKSDGNSQNFDLAPLKPCRMVFASESNKYERFNEAKVKKLTGGNEVHCAFKGKDHFTFRPQFTVCLSSNSDINADPTDDAVWGRIFRINFPNSHLGKENKRLKSQFQNPLTLEGIFRWIVDGAYNWYTSPNGMTEPEQSIRDKDARRSELDTVQAWLDEETEKVDGHFTPTSELTKSYRDWITANDTVSAKQTVNLISELIKKGYTNSRKRVGKRNLRGIIGIKILGLEEPRK